MPSLGPLLRDGAPPHRVYAELVDRLRAAPAPPLLVLEDVHWADDATLDLVRFLVRRLDSLPVLVVASIRDDELAARPELTRVVGDTLREPRVHRVGLAPLTLGRSGRWPATARSTPSGCTRSRAATRSSSPRWSPGGLDSATVRDAVLARVAQLDARQP